MQAPRYALRSGKQPLYWRAIGALKQLLSDGVYVPGDWLPPEDALAQQLGISRSTLREAVSNLETEGLVVRRQGMGTYVARRPEADVLGGLERMVSLRALAQAAGSRAEVVEREFSIEPANAEYAAKLQVEANLPLCHLRTTWEISNQRAAYLDTYMDSRLADMDALLKSDQTLLEYLLEHSSMVPSHAYSVVNSVAAQPDVAQRLQIPQSSPLLLLVEIFYFDTSRPVVLAFNYFLTSRFTYHIVRRMGNFASMSGVPGRPAGLHAVRQVGSQAPEETGGR
jgi:GntR family transcriptional regulator